jgi:hypothetical protein
MVTAFPTRTSAKEAAVTRQAQENCLSQGMAGACVELGVVAVATEARPLHFAFEFAWRFWPHSNSFLRIRSDPGRSSIDRILAGGHRGGAAIAGWEPQGSWTVPYLQPDGAIDELAAMLERGCRRPWNDWLGLTALFIEALPEGNVARARLP